MLAPDSEEEENECEVESQLETSLSPPKETKDSSKKSK